MDAGLAYQIAADREPQAPHHRLMTLANEIYLNHCADWSAPFAKETILFSEFTDFLRTQGTQRERDLVVVSEFFTCIWKHLHIEIMVNGAPMSETQLDDVAMVSQALKRLDLLHLLTNDLRQDLLVLVIDTTNV